MTLGTLLFSGTDLATVCLPTDLNDFWSSPDVRGDLPVYAGMPGAGAVRRPIAAQLRTGELVVFGDSLADTEDAVAGVRSLLREGQAQTVTRRKITGAGNLDTTQTAIVRGAAERWVDEFECGLIMSVETLDGPWYAPSVAIAAVGTIDVEGDSPTRAVTATLSAGAVNPVITNTSNGYSFRYVGTVPAGGVLVDVLAKTATGITGSVNLTANLRWSKDDPFQLDPGSQTLTTSMGTPAFTYLPAYI